VTPPMTVRIIAGGGSWHDLPLHTAPRTGHPLHGPGWPRTGLPGPASIPTGDVHDKAPN
jgi:hypothetical protein